LFNFFSTSNLQKQLHGLLGIKPGKIELYTIALSHRSLKESPDANNERLEYLGDAILSAIVADYLFKRYPLKGEGFLTEMRSKMVNRNQLNDIAIKMGIKQLAIFNKLDGALRNSQIFGNTLEALVGAVYLDKGYVKTQKWVLQQIVMPHMFVEALESVEINTKNKLIGWANKNNKDLLFDFTNEKMEGSKRVFTLNIVIEGNIIATARGYNKKDTSEIAAQSAVAKLGLT
jgi:ribonuclease III